MKYVGITLGVIAVVVVATLLIGWLMPVQHRASRQATLQVTPEYESTIAAYLAAAGKRLAGVQ